MVSEAQEDELEGLDGPPELIMVGYDIQVPHEVAGRRRTHGAFGIRPEEESCQYKRISEWVDQLAAFVKTLHDDLRPQIQPERFDHMGTTAHWVIVWWDRAHDVATPEQIESVRINLENEDYHVSSISLHYDPATA